MISWGLMLRLGSVSIEKLTMEKIIKNWTKKLKYSPIPLFDSKNVFIFLIIIN